MIRKKIVLLYILMLLICLCSFVYYNKIIYNKVQIISDSNNTTKILDARIPTKIIISNSMLGSTEITDKFLLNDILKYIRTISNSSVKSSPSTPKDNAICLNGKILYLNGESNTFRIDSNLLIDNCRLYNNSYLINTLRNMLVDSLYNFNNLIQILNNPNSKIIFSKNHTTFLLDNFKKEKLIDRFKNLKIMNNNRDFLKTNLNENPKFHLKIYIKNVMDFNSDNIILLDAYKNYTVVQYLGDENGKNIYIEGDIDENLFK